MTNIQFNNQENQTNFIPHEQEVAQPSFDLPPRRNFRFVPMAILASFVFIGGLIFYKMQITDKERNLTAQLDVSSSSLTSSNQPSTAGNIVRETPIQPQDQIVINPEDPAIRATTNAAEDIEKPASPTTFISEASPQPTSINRNIIPTATSDNKGIIVTSSPTPTPPTTSTLKATPTPTPKPVTTVSTSTTNNTQPTSGTTTITKTTYIIDDRYKPNTPYLETCGQFEDGKWQNAKIVLPKFDKNNENASEYWVQVGKNHNANDVFDHKYQQTDRVVFELKLDNHQEYFVRFAIKIGQGEFQKWSNTLRFKCERS